MSFKIIWDTQWKQEPIKQETQTERATDAKEKRDNQREETKEGCQRNSFHFPRMLASFFIHPREIQDHLKSTHGPFLPRSPWYIVRKEISVVDSRISA